MYGNLLVSLVQFIRFGEMLGEISKSGKGTAVGKNNIQTFASASIIINV